MKYRVQIADKAVADAEAVMAWFQRERATAAGAGWFASLWKLIETLETRPERCSLAAESADVGIEIRELLFGRRRGQYRILFQIEGKTVQFLRIWHSAGDAVSSDDL